MGNIEHVRRNVIRKKRIIAAVLTKRKRSEEEEILGVPRKETSKDMLSMIEGAKFFA